MWNWGADIFTTVFFIANIPILFPCFIANIDIRHFNIYCHYDLSGDLSMFVYMFCTHAKPLWQVFVDIYHETTTFYRSLNYFFNDRLYHNHWVKSVHIRSFFWSAFSCIQSEYRKIRSRKNSAFGHFSRSEIVIWAITIFRAKFNKTLKRLMKGY